MEFLGRDKHFFSGGGEVYRQLAQATLFRRHGNHILILD